MDEYLCFETFDTIALTVKKRKKFTLSILVILLISLVILKMLSALKL